jgi:hypothetical protein
MKPSNDRLQKQAMSYDDGPCNERKCANCFDNRGCIYDRYITNANLQELEVEQIRQFASHENAAQVTHA